MVLTVVDIDRGKVRIGITAPKDIPIYRAELITIQQSAAIQAAATEREEK